MKDILIRGASGRWEEPSERGYAKEFELQQTLADHPQLIPGVSEGAKTCREFKSDVGPADIVIVEPNGEVTLVECKLASNPQIRREIIGQMFDYASQLWTMDIDEFDRRWRDRNRESLFDGSSDAGFDLRSAVAVNLQGARFRIVLAVDTINKDLRRIVEFLNRALGSEISVVAVEYVRAVHAGIEILVPRSYGAELAEVKRSKEERSRETWNVEKHRRWLSEHDPDNLRRFDHFLEEGKSVGLEYFGTANAEPTGGLRVITHDEVWIGTLYFYYYSGQRTSLELSFRKVRAQVPVSESLKRALDEFITALGAEPVFAEAARILHDSDFSKRPNIPFSEISEESVHRLMQAVRPLVAVQVT